MPIAISGCICLGICILKGKRRITLVQQQPPKVNPLGLQLHVSIYMLNRATGETYHCHLYCWRRPPRWHNQDGRANEGATNVPSRPKIFTQQAPSKERSTERWKHRLIGCRIDTTVSKALSVDCITPRYKSSPKNCCNHKSKCRQ